MARDCLLAAWKAHAPALRGYLRRHLPVRGDADDLRQEVFLKALAQGGAFCGVQSPGAWLLRIARNALIDHRRRARIHLELPPDLAAEAVAPAPVERLSDCLPRALAELPAEDRDALVRCDIEGMTQAEYARLKEISLPGAKSRVQLLGDTTN